MLSPTCLMAASGAGSAQQKQSPAPGAPAPTEKAPCSEKQIQKRVKSSGDRFAPGTPSTCKNVNAAHRQVQRALARYSEAKAGTNKGHACAQVCPSRSILRQRFRFDPKITV